MTYQVNEPWLNVGTYTNSTFNDLGLMGINKFTPTVGISAALGIGALALSIFGVSKLISKKSNMSKKLVKAGVPLVIGAGMGVASVMLYNKEKASQGASVNSANIPLTPIVTIKKPTVVARNVSAAVNKAKVVSAS